ncbi:MAG: serine--tRNA ligase [SAR202 cluster bacterium]|nr:serine--tRNA ligase [SAR202 cluster bacterium]
MLSIELIRNEPDRVRASLARRGYEAPIDRVLEIDACRRNVLSQADQLRARRNEVSRQIGQSKDRPSELIIQMTNVGDKIKELEVATRRAEDELNILLLDMPNLPADDVPDGLDDDANVVEHTVGVLPSFNFEPQPHWEIGERLGIIDFQRGAKLSGSRFFVLKNKGARLQRALISWMLDLHTSEHGYTEFYLPYLVSRETATISGQLPKFDDTMYHDEEDDLWLVPTAEMPITSLHKDEILSLSELPLNYVAHTPSFRREKAAAGRDTRGIKRVHQFEKVEMYVFTEPEKSNDDLNKLLTDAEDVCARLELPYRVLRLCAGGLGVGSAKSFDIEMWAAGCGEWLEVSSCSNCLEFQARRGNIRYRQEAEMRPRFVHTLNGSGLALPRVVIAILENNQQADGSVLIPKVLQPYTGFDRIG